MDHITLPKESTLKLPEVSLPLPELAAHMSKECDVTFSEYPKCHDFEDLLLVLQNGDISKLRHSPQETSAFLQQWLFFYFLKGTIGTPLPPNWEAFSRRSPGGGTLLSTEKLNCYLERWAAIVHGRGLDVSLLDCFKQASFWTSRLLDLTNHELLLPPEAMLAITVLGSTVYRAYRTATHTQSHSTFRMYMSTAKSSQIIIPPLLRTWLLTAGYCEYDIAKLAQTQDISTMLYLSGLPGLRSENHDRCSESECHVMQIDENHYRTRHTSQSCICHHISADIPGVKDILKKGRIPVVNTEYKCKKVLEVDDSDKSDEESSTGRKPYVAISHVWADGLGNTSGNSLPTCQLERLRNLLRKFDPVVKNHLKMPLPSRLADDISPNADDAVSSYLWIDTLCIPRPTSTCGRAEKQEMETCRQQAIAYMNDTYVCAGAVLVLDSDLLSIPYDRPLQELMPRILVCGWMKRLWTYLEAGLASKKLYIQFQGGALHVRQGLKCLHEEVRGDPLGYNIACRVLQDFDDLYSFFVSFAAGGKDRIIQEAHPVILQRYLHDSQMRTTTRPDDRYICLAIVLGLPREAVKKIARSAGGEKTLSLIQNFKWLPRSIIYSPGVKLLKDGYRWACQRFWETVVDQDLLDHEYDESAYVAGGGTATLRPDGGGLEIKSTGVILKPGKWLVDSVTRSEPWICNLPVYWTSEGRILVCNMLVDGHALNAMHSIAKVFEDENWWEKRAIVALIPDLLYGDDNWAAMPGALLVVTQETPWDSIARVETVGDESSDEEFGHAFPIDTRKDWECRYICSLTSQRVRDDDPQLPHPECHGTYPLERHWRVL